MAQEAATLARDGELRDKPVSDGAIVATLKSRSAVTLHSRQGAWAQISTADGRKGWIRLLNLRTASGQRGDLGLGALASAFKTGSSGTTVSTGVKGLSEAQLENAQPDPEQVKKLELYRSTPTQAKAGASTAGLKTKTVAYLEQEQAR